MTSWRRRIFSFWVIFPVLAVGCLVVFTFLLPIRLVATGSMSPTIQAGSLIMNMPVSHVEKGQVITFREEPKGDLVTHRVFAVDSNGDIQTKGDANPTPDVHAVPLRMSEVVGVVVGGHGVPMVTAIAGVIAILLALVLLYAVQQYRSLQRKQREEENEPAPLPLDQKV